MSCSICALIEEQDEAEQQPADDRQQDDLHDAPDGPAAARQPQPAAPARAAARRRRAARPAAIRPRGRGRTGAGASGRSCTAAGPEAARTWRCMVADMAAGRVIGVDLGGTKLLAGTVDSSLNVHHRAHRFARGNGTADVLDTIVDAVREARDAAEGEVDAVGFGIPSLIDQERGVAVTTVHLPIRDLPFRDLMAERLGVPVFIDNDATAAMLAEWRFGAARGCSDALLITVGTGIGGGMVAGGALVRGAQGAAAEFGHMTIDYRRPAVPVRRARLPRGVRVRDRAGARGARAGARHDRCAGVPSWRTTAMRRAARSWPRWGPAWGRDREPRQRVQPAGRRRRRRRARAGRPAARARRARRWRGARWRRRATWCRSCRRASAPSRGCSARRSLALEGVAAAW